MGTRIFEIRKNRLIECLNDEMVGIEVQRNKKCIVKLRSKIFDRMIDL